MVARIHARSSPHGSARRVCTLVAVSLIAVQMSCGGGDDVQHTSAASADTLKRIARENTLPGTSAWLLNNPAFNGEIAAYPNRESYAAGSEVKIAVSADPPGQFLWQLFRMGSYQGDGGRQYAEGGPLDAVTQTNPSFDGTTGLVTESWAPTFSVMTRDEDGTPWLTGVYLVLLTKEDGLQCYVIFILRDDTRDAEVAVQLPMATYQAYNDWGGESLYTSQHGMSGGKARKVSLDRPINAWIGFGSGFFLNQEQPAVRWLEEHGYDVEYVSSLDTGGPNGRVGTHRLYISVGHDEYATMAAFDRLSAAVASGTSIAFLTGNTMYWQVRYEDGDRVIVCYKDRPEEDPLFLTNPRLVSTRFRNPPVNRPENELIGIMSDGSHINAPVDWIVTGADHWVYAGTGLAEGARLSGVVGGEWDGLVENGRTPDGIRVLASREVPNDIVPGSRHEATIYERGSAFVFAAGTMYFARGLDTEPAVEKILTNLLTRAGATAYQP